MFRINKDYLHVVMVLIVMVCVAIFSQLLPKGKAANMNSLAQAFFYSMSGIAVIIGLQAWRRKLLGERKIDLAASIISGIYKLRDEVKTFRLDATYGMENPIDGQKLKILEERFVPTEQAMSDLYKFVPLSKAFLAEDFETIATPLFDMVKKLRTASRVWTTMQGTPSADKAYKTLAFDSERDEFQTGMNELIESISTRYAKYVK